MQYRPRHLLNIYNNHLRSLNIHKHYSHFNIHTHPSHLQICNHHHHVHIRNHQRLFNFLNDYHHHHTICNRIIIITPTIDFSTSNTSKFDKYFITKRLPETITIINDTLPELNPSGKNNLMCQTLVEVVLQKFLGVDEKNYKSF
uniref:Uncharacterized protein n=1 Tax=Pectinophora gossypiella TaxID=13191 RepID=A0A1E1WTY4_PECGO